MSQAELCDLADDIKANGLRDPITLTPDGQLLDGRNRALACVQAGVEIGPDKIVVEGGSAAGQRGGGSANAVSNETALTNAQAAAAAGIPEAAIDSAKVVLKHGTPEEIDQVKSGEVKVRKQADNVRTRKAAAKPAPAKPRQPKLAKVDINDSNRVILALIGKCADSKWRTAIELGQVADAARSTIPEHLKRLGDAVRTRERERGTEFLIEGDRDALLARAGFAPPAEIGAATEAKLLAEIVALKGAKAKAEAEIAKLTQERDRLRAEVAKLTEKSVALKGALLKAVAESDKLRKRAEQAAPGGPRRLESEGVKPG
jgi:hypothetical protein